MVKIKKDKKQKVKEVVVPEEIAPPMKRSSEDPVPRKAKWINKQRVLVFASRGINYRHRHLMEDIKKIMPHHKTESKMERSKNLFIVNEICEVKNCNKALLFEGRRKADLYMWMANVPNGPSVKFLIENIYTMEEMKLTGNCLRGSRPILSFEPKFDKEPHYMLMKSLISQVFGVPNHHPKSQPFFDRVYTFAILDNRIWFRHFQILSEDGALVEIGPRFVLNPVKIFDGSFGGQPLWENPLYVSPAKYRQAIKKKASNKYVDRVEQKAAHEATRPKTSYDLDPLDDIFASDPKEMAKQIQENGTAENTEDLNGELENEEPPTKKSKKQKSIKKTKDEDESANSEADDIEAGSFVKLNKAQSSPKKDKKDKLKQKIKAVKTLNKKSKVKKLKVKIKSKKLNGTASK